jgi:hypothetical protein
MKYLLIILSLVFFQQVDAQGVNRPKNDYLYDLKFDLLDSSFSKYILFVPSYMNRTSPANKVDGSYPLILDSAGYVAMYYKTENPRSVMFQYFEQLNQFSVVHINGSTPHYYILNDQFEVIDSVQNSAGMQTEGHEYNLLDNGNRIIAGLKYDTVDLSGVMIGGSLGLDSTVLRGFVIEELDAADNLVFQWNSNDYVSPAESNLLNGYLQQDFDYCHGNAIEKDADGDYYVSFRNTSSIYKIDGTNGAVLWRLGGTNSSFTFPNDSGFSGQHDIRVLPNGNISLFDNGNTKPGTKYSRAIEIALDMTAMEATVVWEYRRDSTVYAPAMGNHHTTSDRIHLINYGRVLRPYPSITVTDDNADEMCHVYFQDSVLSYRSYLMTENFELNRPKLQCTRTNGNVALSLDSNYQEMIWSTNDTVQSIVITQPGTYQAWFKRGNAMIGTYPEIIVDISQYCLSTGIDTLVKEQVNQYKTVYYNLLGQIIQLENYHGFYLERTTSGEVIKRMR